ncbi:MAG TPA: GNAT family N-acetyltransferase [Puia sp.]|nr:GNAT family N-acetyltransferase [Puia sp.]
MSNSALPPDGVHVYEKEYEKEVIDLILSIQRTEFGIPVSIGDQPDLQTIPLFYQVNKGNFWIALRQGKVVGTIALLDIGKGRGALRKMFVDAAWRGKEYRVAQALLNTLLAWAIDRSYTEILLGTTEKFIAAHRFYEKNSFVEIPKNSLPPEFPVMAVDVKFYRLGTNNQGIL